MRILGHRNVRRRTGISGRALLAVAAIAVMAVTVPCSTAVAGGGSLSGATASPMTDGPGNVRLALGAKPPQFIVVSFDGASWHALWGHWLGVAQATHESMTFFLSGVYLLPPDRA